MKSEIASLMELFLEDDPKKLKRMIKDRMAEVTENLTAPPPIIAPYMQSHAQAFTQEVNEIVRNPAMANQSPSMQRLMRENPDLVPKIAPPVTPAAAQALAARQALIMGAGKEKEDGRTSKRKM